MDGLVMLYDYKYCNLFNNAFFLLQMKENDDKEYENAMIKPNLHLPIKYDSGSADSAN